MVDTAFDDFLDSDDDAFFLEASNCFQGYDLTPESTQTKETNASPKQSKAAVSFKKQNNVSDTSKISSNESKDVAKNLNVDTDSSEALVNSNPDCKISSFEYELVDKITFVTDSSNYNSNKTIDCNRITSEECKSINTEISVVAPLLECKTPTAFPDLNKSSTAAVPSYINSRFTPGFTPKAKKRKLPGPAGFLEIFNGSKKTETGDSSKMLSMDMEFENILSSQYTPELLLLSSWQKLQTAVSSCSNLHSTAKYYSIQRVLQESSKKKLPKHMIVPILCVLLKKQSNKGSATISVFMDDTGEINGKIDSEVLSLYKEFLVEGTALILEKVTFLCNVLILKTQNLVSMYHPDGTEKHPQSLESILETSEPLKPMNCECLKLSHAKNGDKTSNNHKSSCISHSQNRLKHISNQTNTIHRIPQNNRTTNSYKSICNNSQNQSKINTVSNQNKTLNKNVPSTSSKLCPISEANHSKSMRSDAFLENLLDEDNCMDEFDELLGNLDEKSFIADV